ncbi:ABC transporter substrate-binding protein (plasmid) [Aminobacter sp. P9b]|uniref:Spermidine/putrescine transport system substrate-binding protein n=1 Tax=Aminobacter niigataensis TaxID=83265 RepID=A0ABR6L601_9HYPH|nr:MULTISPECIES: ABC transporter substrate-binding protein [Aminobacter]AWC25805.1 Spermidine/putrescine-binding periplasmic protein precursor [Aminobacter sp. MSH1]MBB4652218.1 putative spermidine/putrescine transport system substrate-binding protein [Aminobacter niigataensis]CAI2936533.1 ABC transporter, periplasmic spermidine putrescine-binding protein potD (TC_3.A.1.11.1) [Aminobacter niigataensis]
MKNYWIGIGAMALASFATQSGAQEKLIVSTWGGNWKDGTAIIAKEFTKRTGMEVEFITGGTLDRLAKAKVAKGNPESDVTYTTSHVGALYQSDGLFEKLDMSKVPNAADLYPAGDRGGYEMGVYSYVYSPAFRTDLMPEGFKIDSWKVLWDESMKSSLGLPDFDPSHVVIAASVMEGKSPADWESITDKLTALKPNIKAFYQSDATSQDLIRTGETPVQVLLSINGYHLIEQGLPIEIAIPKEGAVVGIGALGINTGTKKLDAAHEFINVALDPIVQQEICEFHKCSPMNRKAKISEELAKLPGIFTTDEQWKTQAIVLDDATYAKLLPQWKIWFTENMMQ